MPRPNEVAVAVSRLADLVERELQSRRASERAAKEAEGTPHRDPDREYDYVGRKVIHRADARMFLKGIPGLAGQFSKTVPDGMFARVAEDEVEIACPCGQTHAAKRDLIGGGECGRAFIWDGEEVYVAGTPDAS